MLNMLTIVALHNILFHLQTSGVDPTSQAVENGLTNWKHVWEKMPPLQGYDCPANMWKRIGFMQHAKEFWLLANIILDRFRRLQSDETGVAEPGRGVLHGYDETDMSQMNGLIAEFRSICLSLPSWHC